MATTTRKPIKGDVGQQSKAWPESSSKPSKGSADARRESHARRASILLKHVSDPTRLQVLLILAEGQRDVGTLCVDLGQSQPAVSHHLALLRHGGVIVPRRQGTKNFYGLTDTGRELVGVVQKLLDDGSRNSADEAWSLMNRRRAELIFKKNRGHLNDAESSEFERLQTLSRSRMQREFPGPTLIDERLKKIEERLRGDGVEKA
jgi:DNA-binding transcriptional ArsR family regulator